MRRRLMFGLAGLSLIAAGCGSAAAPDKPELATVTGKLVQKGAPLADAYVEFVHERGAPSTGRSDAEGKFALTYTDGSAGATIGTHKVKVTVGGMVFADAGGGSSEPAAKPPKPPTPPVLYVLPEPVKVSAGPNALDLTVPEKGQPG
jgi:hypothetical protein